MGISEGDNVLHNFETEEEGSIDFKSQRAGRAGAKPCLLAMIEALLMDSMWLWLPTQHLYKIKTTNILVWSGKGFTSPTPNLGAEEGSWLLGGESQYLYRMWLPCTQAPKMVYTQKYMGNKIQVDMLN